MTVQMPIRLKGADAQRMLIAGRSGMGKTTLARLIAERAGRAVWVDPKGMNEVGWQTVVKADLFVDQPSGAARALLLRRLLEEHTRIVVQLSIRPDLANDPATGAKLQVDAVAEAAYLLGNVLFACDDMQGVYTSTPGHYLHAVATMGRSRGVGALCLVTSVISFPLDFLRSANHVVSFAMHEDAEVFRLAKVRPEFAQVGGLARYEYVWAYLDDPTMPVEVYEPLPVEKVPT